MIEHREGVEFRVAGRTLSGIALRYGDVATLPGFRERFMPGAFGGVDRIAVNVQHDPSLIVASDASLIDSDRELRVRAELPANSAALALVRRGAVSGFSIEFHSRQERREGDTRVVERAELTGLALVDRGAYPQSTTEVRTRSGRTIRGTIPSGKNVECRCSGATRKFARIAREGLQGAIDEAFEEFAHEVVAGFGSYDSPLASASLGTVRARMRGDDADVEIELPVGPERDAVRRAHENSGIILRPFLGRFSTVTLPKG